uniref:Adenylylsulfate reductase subunit alpha protein n=1 Tax=uncultured bacterium CSL132 TaxID=1091568 RepID=G4WVK8_9BACT|nr:adenylylsulfate reductase subunit alpha protein [uncultured bacterium CSL132]
MLRIGGRSGRSSGMVMNINGEKLNGIKKPEGDDDRGKAPADLNLRRRRLVRGVTAVAPLILTLRSGALAAASCTGVKAINVYVDSNNKPALGTPGEDYCATQNTSVNSTCVAPGQLTIDTNYINASSGRCGSGHAGQRVAILSSASVTSLLTPP